MQAPDRPEKPFHFKIFDMLDEYVKKSSKDPNFPSMFDMEIVD